MRIIKNNLLHTGKMELINPNEIGTKITTLIKEAKVKFYAVTPYLGVSEWKKVLVNLKSAIKKGVDVKFFYREIKNSDYYTLKNIGVELIRINKLHTKLYFNEKEAIVSSMNLYEYSDLYSKDIALYFSESKDYEKINTYFNRYINQKGYSVSKNSEEEGITNIYKLLKEKFPNSEIDKEKDYLFTKNLVPVYHLFIKTYKITIKHPHRIKYPYKDYYYQRTKSSEENFLKKYCKEDVKFRPFTRDCFLYWDIFFEKNDFEKILEIIEGFRCIKLYK